MQTAIPKALALILSADAELCDILAVTAKMSLASSLIALIIGVPIGIWLGSGRFPGRGGLRSPPDGAEPSGVSVMWKLQVMKCK